MNFFNTHSFLFNFIFRVMYMLEKKKKNKFEFNKITMLNRKINKFPFLKFNRKTRRTE